MMKIYCTSCQIIFILIAWYASSSLKINWAIWLAYLRGVYPCHRKDKHYCLPRAQTFLLAHSFGLISKLKISPKPQNQSKFHGLKQNEPGLYLHWYLVIIFICNLLLAIFLRHILVICILIDIWSVYLSGIY